MANVTLNVNDRITASLAKMTKRIQQLPREAYDVFVQETPIRTGNARRRTKLVKEEIQANYQYAQPLDNGHSSQSPEGMTKPTEKFIEKRLQQIIRK